MTAMAIDIRTAYARAVMIVPPVLVAPVATKIPRKFDRLTF